MRVVLLDDIAGLGEAGAIVEVKNGFARNWLLPKRLAERATADAINRVTLIQRAAEVKRARRRSEAAEKFTVLNGKSISLTVKAGSAGRIFGSITSSAIVDEVRKQLGVELDRRHIQLEEPIKHLGEFEVPLRAAADVTGSIKVVVEPEGPRGQRGRGAAGGRRGSVEETAPVVQSEPMEQTAGDGEILSDGTEGVEASREEAALDTAGGEDRYEHIEEEVAG
jgi:large subunit ribosomal protein L9